MGPRSFYLALFSWGQWLKLYLMYAFLTFKTEFLSMNYWSHKWLDSYPKALVSLCVAAFSILWEKANVKFGISLTMDSWHFQEEGIIASLMLSSHGTSEAVPTQSLSLEMAFTHRDGQCSPLSAVRRNTPRLSFRESNRRNAWNLNFSLHPTAKRTSGCKETNMPPN